MSVTPSISLVAYEARDGRVFVKVPNERGRYMLVDRCVIEVDCPQCKSARGEPCKGAVADYAVDTHVVRRNKYRAIRRGWQLPPPDDQLSSKPHFKLINSRG